MSRKKKVRIFRQNASMETCLCCCVLMVLDYYHKLPRKQLFPTRKMEEQLYRYMGYHIDQTSLDYRFTKGTPLSAAAYYFVSKQLFVTMYHSEAEYLNNTCEGRSYYPQEIFPYILEKYKYWIALSGDNIIWENCKELCQEFLKDLLDQEKLIVAACVVDREKGGILHAVIVDAYHEEEGNILFHLCDPACGKYFYPGNHLVKCMHTPVGIHFLTVNDRNKCNG